MTKEKCTAAFENILLPEYQRNNIVMVLFDSRYIKFNFVIHPAFFNHSFPLIWEIFCRKPLSKPVKTRENGKQNFLSFPSK